MNCHCAYKPVPPSLLESTRQRIYSEISKNRERKIKKVSLTAFIVVCFLFLYFILAHAEIINIEKLADSIYWAEGGAKTNHPYGILAHYKHTTPRMACINTINSSLRRFAKQTKERDFIHFLSLTYCPIGCSNDNGTNRFWERNVKYFLAKCK